MRRSTRNNTGFTLAELLIGMLITSVLLTAVATLAFALSAASTASSDAALRQAQLRQTMLRLNDLIGTCQLLCAAPGNDLVLWRADDNANKQINVNELVYLERGASSDMLRFCQFTAAPNPTVLLSDLTLATTKAQLLASYPATYTPLLPQCGNVTFTLSPGTPVTGTKRLTVSFTLTENGVTHRYETVMALRGRAANLLTPAGDALVVLDDD